MNMSSSHATESVQTDQLIYWSRYVGYELVSADDVRLGIVRGVTLEDTTDECCLQVATAGANVRQFCVPVKFVGVIGKSTLVLDATRNRFQDLRLGSYSCDRRPVIDHDSSECVTKPIRI